MALPPVLQPLWDSLLKDTMFLHFKWKVFRDFYGKDEARVDFLNAACAPFFGLLQNVFLLDILLGLARVTDPPQSAGRSNASIPKLLAEIADTGGPPSYGLEDKCDRLKQCCAGVRELRNRLLAHRDYEVAVTGAAVQVDSREQVQLAMDALAEFMNSVLDHFGEVRYGTFTPMGPNFQAAEELLWVLKRGLRHAELEQRAQRGRICLNEIRRLAHNDAPRRVKQAVAIIQVPTPNCP